MTDAMAVLHDACAALNKKCPIINVHNLLFKPGYLFKLYCPYDITVSGDCATQFIISHLGNRFLPRLLPEPSCATSHRHH